MSGARAVSSRRGSKAQKSRGQSAHQPATQPPGSRAVVSAEYLLGGPNPGDDGQSNPYKINYWCKDDKFADDGSSSPENMNGLRRRNADLRARLSKL